MAFRLVATAAPKTGLSAEIVESLERLPGSGPARRLSASAAEVALARPVDLAIPNVDVNIVPAEGRAKRLLIADMDSTMIPVECIDEMADFAGVRDEVAAITESAMRGETSFEEALRARVALMKGLPETCLREVHDRRVSLNPGAASLVRTMRAKGAYTALVSGGFTFFSERVAEAAGFDEHRANRLAIEGGRLTGGVIEPILGRAAKLEALQELVDRLGIRPRDVLAVGDGANDLAMIGAAGLGVAFRAKPALAERADARIEHGDLTALLHLQGCADRDFAA